MFVGLLTAYTARHPSISSSILCPCLQAYLQPTPPGTLVLATALYVPIYRSTYVLYHHTPQH